MTKEKTARLIPNAIQIATKGEKVKNCIKICGFLKMIMSRAEHLFLNLHK